MPFPFPFLTMSSDKFSIKLKKISSRTAYTYFISYAFILYYDKVRDAMILIYVWSQRLSTLQRKLTKESEPNVALALR